MISSILMQKMYKYHLQIFTYVAVLKSGSIISSQHVIVYANIYSSYDYLLIVG